MIIYSTVLYVFLILILLYFILKNINKFFIQESFQSFNISDYIPSNWEQTPTGFGRNTTGCSSNPNKIWEIKEPSDVKNMRDNIKDNDLIIIYGHVDCTKNSKIEDMSIELKDKENITVVGTDNAHFAGSVKIGGKANNIIIRNIFFDGLFKDGDTEDKIKGKKPEDYVAIKGEDVRNIWVDHCTFTKSADGLLDMTNGATNITVSWCILGDPTKSRNRKDGNSAKKDTTHHKVMLIGAGDHSNGSSDEQRDMKVQITVHHCWFPGNSRNPRIRYARPIHLYNNFYDQNSYYTIAARQKTISLSENSFFYRSGRPYDTENDGKLYIIGDTYKDTCTSDPQPLHMSEHSSAKLSNCAPSLGGTGDEGNYVFQKDDDLNDIMKDRNNNNETYDYVLDNAEDVPALVTSKAGAGGNGYPGWTPDYTLPNQTTITTTTTTTSAPIITATTSPPSNIGCTERDGGVLHNGTCYYEYTNVSTCQEIGTSGSKGWKKCDATRGDKTGDPDSGRYIRNGDSKIFCKWVGEKDNGECVPDIDDTTTTSSPITTTTTTTSAPITTTTTTLSPPSNIGCTERGGGVLHNGTCYYEYTNAATCQEIGTSGSKGWKKCDATRGDKTGDPDSGRYIRDGDSKIFCKWVGEKDNGECVPDIDDTTTTTTTLAPVDVPPVIVVPPPTTIKSGTCKGGDTTNYSKAQYQNMYGRSHNLETIGRLPHVIGEYCGKCTEATSKQDCITSFEVCGNKARPCEWNEKINTPPETRKIPDNVFDTDTPDTFTYDKDIPDRIGIDHNISDLEEQISFIQNLNL